jgi:hypothetical protein
VHKPKGRKECGTEERAGRTWESTVSHWKLVQSHVRIEAKNNRYETISFDSLVKPHLEYRVE